MTDIKKDINSFRKKRGVKLAEWLDQRAEKIGRKLRVLDVGGRPQYWFNVDCHQVDHITVMNVDESQYEAGPEQYSFDHVVGDATELKSYDDHSFDVYHSNSVIEHVGSWQEVSAFASEAVRVAPRVQTHS